MTHTQGPWLVVLQRLKEARDAIASLPDDALGISTAGANERYHWYIKDELLAKIDDAIAQAERNPDD